MTSEQANYCIMCGDELTTSAEGHACPDAGVMESRDEERAIVESTSPFAEPRHRSPRRTNAPRRRFST